MKNKKLVTFLYTTLFVITLIALIVLFSVHFIKEAFGSVTLSQILFHLRIGVGETGISPELEATIIETLTRLLFSVALLSFLAWIGWRYDSYQEIIKSLKSAFIKIKNITICIKSKTFLLIRNLLNKLKALIKRFPLLTRPVLLVILISISVIFYSLKTAERRLQLSDYLLQESSTWLQENFAVLDTSYIKHISGKKRNLILVFLESVEDGFVDEKIYGENLIQELSNLKKEGISFNGYQRTVGSRYTMDGLCALLMGVPLEGAELVDFSRTTKFDVLLRNAPSILNLLQNDGYKTSFFVGSSGKFTQKANFFEAHGIDRKNIYTREIFQKNGYRLSGELKGSEWGFCDEFVWSQAKQWITENYDKKTPFLTVIETLDTHFPNGFTKAKYRKFGDVRDAFRAASIMASEFVTWAKQQPWYQDTTIVFVGDHPWQDQPNDFTNLYTKNSSNRQIFNLFINSVHKKPTTTNREWTAMDIAPTILDSMGIEYRALINSKTMSNNQIGIGLSLFSDEKNFIEIYGMDFLWTEMKKKSTFYNSLF